VALSTYVSLQMQDTTSPDAKLVLASPLRAVSIINQMELIARLIKEKGHICKMVHEITIPQLWMEKPHALLWFRVCCVEFLNDVVPVYLYTNIPKAVYVTVEGVPAKEGIMHTNLTKLEYIANSRFTAECLRMAGLKVIDVVHHAVDWMLCYRLFKMKQRLKQRLKQQYGDRCILLVNCRNDPRKGLKLLANALKIVEEKWSGKFLVLLHINTPPAELLELKCVKIHSGFGSMPHYKVLELMCAVDYLIFPSVCEGFGIPVLEANAVGTPVIHCWMPPLDEFSSKEFNFVFPFAERRTAKPTMSQYWVFHLYDPEWLADMINYAIDVYYNSREEYEEYCRKANEHAQNWDYHVVYQRLLRHLGI